MKSSLTNLVAIAFLVLAIAITPLSSALAGTIKSDAADTAKQAAKEVVKETGVKQQFGKSANGDRLLDQAQEKASKKLNNLGKKADSTTKLPETKKLFLDNLSDQS